MLDPCRNVGKNDSCFEAGRSRSKTDAEIEFVGAAGGDSVERVEEILVGSCEVMS